MLFTAYIISYLQALLYCSSMTEYASLRKNYKNFEVDLIIYESSAFLQSLYLLKLQAQTYNFHLSYIEAPAWILFTLNYLG